jgi:hypothetical protein
LGRAHACANTRLPKNYCSLYDDGKEVARGIEQAIEAGDALERLVFSPSEEAIEASDALERLVFSPSEEAILIIGLRSVCTFLGSV